MNSTATSMSSTGNGTGGNSEGGAGGGNFCTPGEEQPCYTGPSGTLGIGLCSAGTATCNERGSAFGPCVGYVLPAVEDCITRTDENCDGLRPQCEGSYVWGKRFGSTNDQVGTGVATDASDNVVVTGSFKNTVDFGGGVLTSAGEDDILVAKVDSAGNHLWSKGFGDAVHQAAYAVAVDDSGNVFITGEMTGTVDFGGGSLASAGGSDVVLVKLDPAGGHLWSKRFGTASDQRGFALAIDPAGDVVVVGSLEGSIDFGGDMLASAGSSDIFVAKLDAAGNHLWSKHFGDGGIQTALGVTADSAGNVLITGSMFGSADFGGGILTSAGGSDAFIAKLDAAGNHLWSQRFGDAGAQTGTSISRDAGDNVLATGYFWSTVDFGGGSLTSGGSDDVYVAKLDSAGNHVWSKRFGNAGDQHSLGIATDGASNVLITGKMILSVDFGGGTLWSDGSFDIFVAKLDASGNHLWSHQFGNALSQDGHAVAADGAGNVLLAGEFQATTSFGNGVLSGAGGNDGYLVKLSP